MTQSLNILHDIAKYSSTVGLALLYQNRVYNTVCLLIDGIHYEPRWFHSWASDVVLAIFTPTYLVMKLGVLFMMVML